MWVRSEYAGELAVLSAWLCALLPWSVSYASGVGVRIFRIHFLYLFFQFTPGLALSDGAVRYRLFYQTPESAGNEAIAFSYRLWILAALLFVLPLAFSAVYYVYDERLEEWSPIDPVRLMGVLLIAPAALLTLATYVLTTGFPGISIPIGIVFMYLLGGLLLVVERT